MSELSITVKIAGRQFPLTIQREEEEAVRNAAKMVDEQFRFFSENYAVNDRADLLAMAALQMATAAQKAQKAAKAPAQQAELENLRDMLRASLTD
jgi:cell division protein ZapA